MQHAYMKLYICARMWIDYIEGVLHNSSLSNRGNEKEAERQ